jgi:hypothetical protein
LQLRQIVTRAVLIGGSVAVLGLSAAGAASAATTGGTPEPTGTPTVLYTPPPTTHHHAPKPVRQCFYSWETETDTITLAGQNPEPYGQPTEQYGQPVQPNEHPNTETVKVAQLVRVCVTGAKVDSVTDVGAPFAYVVPTPPAYGPTPITDSYVR